MLRKAFLFFVGRDDRTRTGDPYVPNVVRYQLRYIPIAKMRSRNRGSVSFCFAVAKVALFFELNTILSRKICEIAKKVLPLQPHFRNNTP